MLSSVKFILTLLYPSQQQKKKRPDILFVKSLGTYTVLINILRHDMGMTHMYMLP